MVDYDCMDVDQCKVVSCFSMSSTLVNRFAKLVCRDCAIALRALIRSSLRRSSCSCINASAAVSG